MTEKLFSYSYYFYNKYDTAYVHMHNGRIGVSIRWQVTQRPHIAQPTYRNNKRNCYRKSMRCSKCN